LFQPFLAVFSEICSFLVTQYVGHYIQKGNRDGDDKDYTTHYMFEVSNDYTADSYFQGNKTRYINHSARAPNIDVKIVTAANGEPKIGFFANQNIKAQEELFFDYGDIYNKHWEKGTEQRTKK
jgi:SET domain-containing protein